MLVDAVVGWLVSTLGHAAASASVRLALGQEETRELRTALAVAVDQVVRDAPPEAREPLVRALRERFDDPVVVPRDGSGRLLDLVESGVRDQVESLGDPALTPSGRSFLEEIGIDPGWLSSALPQAVVAAVKGLAASGGGLAPLASQLNFDQIHQDLAGFRTGTAADKPGLAPVRRRADRWDPFALGVNRAIESPSGPGRALPTYVPRDHDARLRASLDPESASNRLVVLVGGSSAGKTRSAVEAVRARLGDWTLVHPLTAAELLTLVRDGQAMPRTVVWLDEAQTYFDGNAGEQAAVAIRRMLTAPGPVVLIGTIWPSYWQGFVTPPGVGEPDPYRQVRGLLRLAYTISVPEQFTPRELGAARELAANDARLAVALVGQRQGDGVTQVLAGGPDLIGRWENAPDRYSRAMIDAAIDARRLGWHSPLTAEILRGGATAHLTGRALAAAPADWFERALDYACAHVRGTVAPLVPIGHRAGQIDGYLLADYLDQHGRSACETRPVPDGLWRAFVSCTRDSDDLNRLGAAAAARGRHRFAAELWSAALARGNAAMVWRLRALLDGAGDSEAGKTALANAAALGDQHACSFLVALLEREGRMAEAEQVLQSAAAVRDPFATRRLAVRLHRSGRTEQAVRLLSAVADDPGCVRLLRVLRGDAAGPPPQREAPMEPSVPAKPSADVVAAETRIVGALCDALGPALESALRSSVRKSLDGEHSSLVRLVRRARTAGRAKRLVAAVRAIHQATDVNTADVDELVTVARLLQMVGRTDDAEPLLRRASANGGTKASLRLAATLEATDRTDEAESILRELAHDDLEASDLLVSILTRTGRAPAAEYLLRKAVRRGNAHALERLVKVLRGAGRAADAERELLDAARTGGIMVMRTSVSLLLESGDRSEAEHTLRRAVVSGDAGALRLLEAVLRHQGRAREAAQVARYGLDQDGSTARSW